MSQRTLLIVFHSRTGGAEHMARAAQAGALQEAGVDVRLLPATQAQVAARPYACMVCAGSDGAGAARQIARIATGWRLHAVAEPLIVCTHAQSPEAIAAPKHLSCTELAACRDLGHALATGLALGIF